MVGASIAFIAKIYCGDDIGTGFLISETSMITARHVIDDSFRDEDAEPVFIQFGSQEKIQVSVVYPNEFNNEIDVAILSLPQKQEYTPAFQLCVQDIKRGDKWHSYGFPYTQRIRGQYFSGSVSQVNVTRMQEDDADLDLNCDEPQIIDSGFVTKGASGAPIVVNNAIIGVFTDKGPGGIIGATTFRRCISIFGKMQITYTTNAWSEASSALSLESVGILSSDFDREKDIVVELIKDFPKETHEFLMNSLNKTVDSIVNVGENFSKFLQHYRHPFIEQNDSTGVGQLVELLTILRCGYKNMNLIQDDINANLCLDESEDIYAYLIYSTKRHAKMPEVVLELFRKKISTPTGRMEMIRGNPVITFPLILDNYSNHKRVNLCRNCKKEFSFEDILSDYTKADETGYFQGIEENNYRNLNSTKVLCGECIRDSHNHVNGMLELESYIRELNKID